MPSARERVIAAVERFGERHQLWQPEVPVVLAVSGGADSLCLLGVLHDLRERHNRRTSDRQNRHHPQRLGSSHLVGERLGAGLPPRQNRQDQHAVQRQYRQTLPPPRRGEGAGGEVRQIRQAPDPLIVAHLDHGLRGADGAADCAFVAELAAALGLPFVGEQGDVRALARAEHCSLEDVARRARYAFLRRIAAEYGALIIATGHTRDDQAETVLLHLLRGSGLAGLAGMAPRTGDLVRPLLEITRAETEAYCAERGWQPREDATNRDPHYTRNRVRHELLPLLETFNPNIRTTLARNAALLAADETCLAEQADAAWHALATTEDPGTIALDLAALRALAPALRTRLYQRTAAQLTGTEARLEARHIAALDDLFATGRAGQSRDLPAPLRALRTADALLLTTAAIPSLSVPDLPARALSVPGTVELPELGWRIRAWLAEGPPGLVGGDAPPPPVLPAFARAGDEGNVGHATTRAYLAPAAADQPLSVRAWRPGDHFRPLGLPHEKKLQDYFSDAKVPRDLRAHLPLVFGSTHLLWIAGLRIDDRAKLPPGAARALVLQLEPLASPSG
jgi:tRNA(Ile)-lysidine synthase